MSLVNESLDRRPPAGLSVRQKVQYRVPGASQEALLLLDRKPPSGLSTQQWAEVGLESAQQTVQMVQDLVGNQS